MTRSIINYIFKAINGPDSPFGQMNKSKLEMLRMKDEMDKHTRKMQDVTRTVRLQTYEMAKAFNERLDTASDYIKDRFKKYDLSEFDDLFNPKDPQP